MITAPKLIFIDGIVGVGKSRLAQRLWLHLRKSGADADGSPSRNQITPCMISAIFRVWNFRRRSTGCSRPGTTSWRSVGEPDASRFLTRRCCKQRLIPAGIQHPTARMARDH